MLVASRESIEINIILLDQQRLWSHPIGDSRALLSFHTQGLTAFRLEQSAAASPSTTILDKLRNTRQH